MRTEREVRNKLNEFELVIKESIGPHLPPFNTDWEVKKSAARLLRWVLEEEKVDV